MNAAELAELAGVAVTDPAVQIASGNARAAALLEALNAAEGRQDVAAVMSGALRDDQTVADLAGLVRHAPGDWAGVLAQLRAVRGISADVRSLRRLVEAAGRGLRMVRTSPADAVPYQPSGWTTPPGYVVDAGGVWRVTDADSGDVDRVLSAPVFVAGRLIDVETSQCAVRLRWAGWNGRPVDHVADSIQIADRAGLITLSAYGLPVGAHNAREVCAYLDAAVASNGGSYPIEHTARRCGWFDGGFLLGDRWIGSDPGVSLRCDEGAQQIASGLSSRGTWAGWLDAISVGRWAPSTWIAIYSSVASVLIDWLDIPTGFIVDWSGETSQGKTTILRVAASVWGEPSQRGLLQSWSLTTARAEGVAALLQHLPILLDDTKQARRVEDVAGLLYAHAWGQSKGRAKPGAGAQSVGLRVSATWRSVMLSTGEARATSFTEDAGARARTLCMVGSPLPSAAIAQELTVGALSHHGHLGPRVIAALQNGNARDRYELAYGQTLKRMRDELGAMGAVAGRLAEPIALLALAAMVAEDAGLPAPPEGVDPIRAAMDAAIEGGRDADRPAAALVDIVGGAFSTPTALYGRHEMIQGAPNVPSGGWIGAMVEGEHFYHVDLRCTWVKDQLIRRRYDVEGTISRWVERGWIDTGSGRGHQRTKRIDGLPHRVYRFKRAALRDVGMIED